MVLYFTGTGNSRYLARRIAEGLEMPLYDLNACIKAGNTAPVQTGRDVTHNMQQATRVSDQTAFFLVGEMVEFGDTKQIFSYPQDKRTEDYITGRFG